MHVYTNVHPNTCKIHTIYIHIHICIHAKIINILSWWQFMRYNLVCPKHI